MATLDIGAFYERRRAELNLALESARRRLRLLRQARLAAFLVGTVSLIALIGASGSGRAPTLTALVAAISAIAFIGLVRTSRIALRVTQRLDGLLACNAEGVARLRRDWGALRARPWDTLDPLHAYATDLDVLGTGSLMQLFPTVSRAPGDTTLSAWMLERASPDDASSRQAAVRELTPLVSFRDELELLGRATPITPTRLARLTTWASARNAGGVPRRLALAAGVISGLTIIGIAAQATGGVPVPLWMLPLGIGLLVTRQFNSRARVMFENVYGHAPVLRAYGEMIDLIGAQQFAASLLQRARETLCESNGSAQGAIRSLARLADSAEVRHSPMLHAIVNALFLWDVQVFALLARWKDANGGRVTGWLQALGTIEALGALASLAHDNPEWVFPELATEPPDTLDASALGHPLLPSAARVGNDVVVGPRGTVLLISGSNMSGKSTLMRAVGTNVVLAQAGSVVCARTMRCPPLDVRTSMRVEDSLQQGVSRFMAELMRIKSVIGGAEASERGGGAVTLYLLDELLQGTNSVERAIAARRVVESLVAHGAIGVVTTHDLSLLESDSLVARVSNAHFREELSVRDGAARPVMSFDYVLRPGKATSSNAIALLELLGVTE